MGKEEENGGGSGMETARTSFCWTYGGKGGREVFRLETTISGTLGEAEIESHIASAIKAMGAVFRHGGRAKWKGQASIGLESGGLERGGHEMGRPEPSGPVGGAMDGAERARSLGGPSESIAVRAPPIHGNGVEDGSKAYEWGRGRTGKSVLLIHKNEGEPDEIECPIHAGKIMRRRSNEGGSWLSHKAGDNYCTARIMRREP